MCGIVGVLTPGRPVDAGILRQMCDAIAHRGPDDEGFFQGCDVGFGARRLSIIDLATGHQPLSGEDRKVWVTFNGEIYNFRELRHELERKGHTFATRTDTEVIAHLYEQYGADCVGRLHGMFAFGIWDSRDRTLFLARDRFGKKPLYYAPDAPGFVFASELKALFQFPGLARSVDPDALNEFLTFGYIHEPRTILKGVFKLKPAHWLRVRDGSMELRRYWRLPDGEPDRRPEADLTEELIERLRESVRLRLVSDVPLGAFLSGGLDSSTVVHFMADLMDRPVKTFSVGFTEDGYSELEHAARVAKALGTDHHGYVLTPDLPNLVQRLAVVFDEPFGDSSAIPTYLVSEAARREVTVALSGDGGDEIFAGYDKYVQAQHFLWADRIPKPMKRLMGGLSERLPVGFRGKNRLRHLSLDRPGRLLDLGSHFPVHMKRMLYTPDLLASVTNLSAGGAPRVSDARGDDNFIPQLLAADLEGYLPGDILVKVDRASMAHSLEVRAPFLDHELVEFVARLPFDLKLRNGVRKYLLRKAMHSRLPDEVLQRGKQGFGAPVATWLRRELAGFTRDLLADRRTRARGYLRPAAVERLFDEHRSGQRDHGERLWFLIVLELWHREYVDRRPGIGART